MASIKYRLYQNNNRKSPCYEKFYGRAVHDEMISLEQLAEHMSDHNTPYSKGTIHGVLQDMVTCIRELLLDSKKVKLDNLAIFSLGLKSTGVDAIDQYNPAQNIVGAHINAQGTGNFSKRQLDISARFKQY